MRPSSIAIVAFVALIATASCKQRCESELDCGPGSYCDRQYGRCAIDCFTHQDCREPVECRAMSSNCVPKGLFCSHRGQCKGRAGERPTPNMPIDVIDRAPDGWSAAPGEGELFVMNTIRMGGQGEGFDLDADGTTDNVLFALADTVNPWIASGLLSGEILLLLEIAGIDEPYDGNDDSVTLKIYGALDADDPVDRTNNFEVPPAGGGRCCEMKIDQRWLTIEDDKLQATIRAPARIQNYRLIAPTNFPHHTFDLQFLLTVGPPPYYYVNIAHSRVELELDSDLARIRNGLLGGGLTANSLAAIRNPFCGSTGTACPSGDPSSTLFDLTSFLAGPSPDVDVDGDGRECALDTNGDAIIDVCCDGAGSERCLGDRVCPGETIESSTGDPKQCALSPDFTDGYSVSFRFTAVKAVLAGVGTEQR